MEKHPQNPTDKIIITVDSDLEDLIPGFLARRQEDLQALRDAIAVADFDQIMKLAHNLKGVGGGYGFDSITSISLLIHQAAERRAKEEIVDRIDELADYLARVDVAFE